MTEAEVSHPATLGFWIPSEKAPDYKDGYMNICLVPILNKRTCMSIVHSNVQQFVKSAAIQESEKVSNSSISIQELNACMIYTYKSA